MGDLRREARFRLLANRLADFTAGAKSIKGVSHRANEARRVTGPSKESFQALFGNSFFEESFFNEDFNVRFWRFSLNELTLVR